MAGTDYYFQQWHRLAWIGNDPNLTGCCAVIAASTCCLLAVQTGSIRNPKYRIALFALAGLATAIGTCTLSRGFLLGMILVCCGFGLALWSATDRIGRGLLLGLPLILTATILATPMKDRSGVGFISQDASVGHRMILARALPHLVRDAPEGWQRPGEAFTTWYSHPSDRVFHHSLVGSHFEIYASLSTWWRLAYLLAWMIPIAAWLIARSHRPAVIWIDGMAIIHATMMAMWFCNRLATFPLSVILTVVGGSVVFLANFRYAFTTWKTKLIAVALGILPSCFAWHVIPLVPSPHPTLRISPTTVASLQTTSPTVVVIGGDSMTYGISWGHALRDWLADDPHVLWAREVASVNPDIAKSIQCVVFVGPQELLTRNLDGSRKLELKPFTLEWLKGCEKVILVDVPAPLDAVDFGSAGFSLISTTIRNSQDSISSNYQSVVKTDKNRLIQAIRASLHQHQIDENPTPDSTSGSRSGSPEEQGSDTR